jgi:hypothetical protein
MAHDQVEGLWLDPVAVQDAIAKVSFTNNPKGNLGVICLTLSLKNAETTNVIRAGGFCLKL